MTTDRTGRGWAYFGTILGAVASLAANIAHSFVAPSGSLPGWRPEIGAVVSSAFWPIALGVGAEILVRTPWPAERRWTAAKFLGLLPVALVAAIVSYRHLSALLAHYGDDWLTAHIGPVAVDGLMVMAAAALLAHNTNKTPEATPAPVVDFIDQADTEPAPVTYVPATSLPGLPPRVNGHAVGSGVIGSGVIR